MDTAVIAEKVAAYLADAPAGTYGLRMIPRKCQPVTVGETLAPSINASQALEEAGIYDEMLPGTCAIACADWSDDYSEHLARVRLVSGYSGRQIALLHCLESEYGEDHCEIVMIDPRVVLTFDLAA